MTLYLYETAGKVPALELKDVRSYTDSRVVTGDGIYGPLAQGYELSADPDCTETLRADWRREHPTAEARLEDLEALMADLLFGGDGA